MTKRILSALLAVLLCLGLLPVAASAAAASTTVELFTETLTGVTVTYDGGNTPAGYKTAAGEWAWNSVTPSTSLTVVLQPNAGTAFFTAPALTFEYCQSTPTVDVAATDNGWYRFTVSNLVGDGTNPVKLVFTGKTETVYTVTLDTTALYGATAAIEPAVVRAGTSAKLTVSAPEAGCRLADLTATPSGESFMSSLTQNDDGSWTGYLWPQNDTTLTLSGGEHYHPVCGLVCTHTPAHEPILFAPWDGVTDLTASGAYALTGDAVRTFSKIYPDDISICLGDHTLRIADSDAALLAYSGVLNLCAHENGAVEAVDAVAVSVNQAATLNLYGGRYSAERVESEVRAVFVAGTLNLLGDVVVEASGTNGNGLFLDKRAKLNIKAPLTSATDISMSMFIPGVFAENAAAYVDCFTSDVPDYSVVVTSEGHLALEKRAVVYAALPGNGSSGGNASFTPIDGVTLPEGTDLIAAPYTPTPDLIADIIGVERPLDPLTITPDVVKTISPEDRIGRYFDQEVRLGSVITYEGEEYLIREIYNIMKRYIGQQYWAESRLYGLRLTDGAQLGINYNIKVDRINRADVGDDDGTCPEKAERQLIIGGVTYLQTYCAQLDDMLYYFTTLDGTPAGFYYVEDGKYTVWFYADCTPERLTSTQSSSDGSVHKIDDNTAIVIGRDGYKQVKVLAAADIKLVDGTGLPLLSTDTKGTVKLLLDLPAFADDTPTEYYATHIESETTRTDGTVATEDGRIFCIFPVTYFSPFIVLAVTDYHPGTLPEVDIPEPEPEPMFSFTQLIPIYRLRFETNGGNPIATQLRMLSNKVDLTRITPKRDGYTFTGWYADPALTEKITETFRMRGNKTVYAGWIETAEP